MPLLQRKRRAPVDEAESLSESDTLPEQTGIRARLDQSPVSGDAYDEDEINVPSTREAVETLARKLVRYALSCEYARQPIRRTDIAQKVLGTNVRQFKQVFGEAQLMLQHTFGMEMMELPIKEKITLQQRRAAQKQEKVSTSTNAWVLTSILPPKFRDPDILSPPRIPTITQESSYVGLYTFIIATIYLAGGALPEAKLERYLRRTNADHSTPVDKTDKLLQRLIREGYIVKIKDSSSGEELVDYMVGPRGKVEVGEDGVAEFVKRIYGQKAEQDLDKRLERSLGLGQRIPPAEQEKVANGASDGGKKRGRPRRAQTEETGADEEDEGEDEDKDEDEEEESPLVTGR